MTEFVPDKLPAQPAVARLDDMIAQCELEVLTRRALLLQQEAALAAMRAEADRIKAAMKPAAAKE